MRQRRWVELFNDFDCEILYRSGKANVVADALSRRGVFYGYGNGSRMEIIRAIECFIYFSPRR